MDPEYNTGSPPISASKAAIKSPVGETDLGKQKTTSDSHYQARKDDQSDDSSSKILLKGSTTGNNEELQPTECVEETGIQESDNIVAGSTTRQRHLSKENLKDKMTLKVVEKQKQKTAASTIARGPKPVAVHQDPTLTVSAASSTVWEQGPRGEVPTPFSPEMKEAIAENEELRAKHICHKCNVNKSDVIFCPCGHKISCKQCASGKQICDKCGEHIDFVHYVKY